MFNQTPRHVSDFLDNAKAQNTSLTVEHTPKMKQVNLVKPYASVMPKSNRTEDIHPVPGKSSFVKNTMNAIDSKR